MYHRDYLIRMIQQFFVFLAKLFGLKQANDPAVVLMQLEGAYLQFTGLSQDAIHSLTGPGLLSVCSATGEVDYNRLAVIAILLREEAETLRSINDPASEQLDAKSDELLSFVSGNESKLDDELHEWFEKNVRKD